MHIHVETSSGMPITRQIAAQIRAQCAGGLLRPGQRLPSVRALAAQLAVNQNTILRVYERLTAEGLLERRHGAGTFVSSHFPSRQLKTQRHLLRQELSRLVELARTLNVEPEDLHRLLEEALGQSGRSVPPLSKDF
ncbi:MAG: GntR family transcriptional regulator [Pirellulales bacterium]|nr:GntR family transcriptional regulator [Pirellulales bacterium]